MGHLKFNSTVGEAVSSDYRTAEVFSRFGIDYYCGGGKTIRDVCDESGVSLKKLELALSDIQYQNEIAKETDILAWPIEKICSHVLVKHHQYIKDSLRLIDNYMKKILKADDHANIVLSKISRIFDDFSKEIIVHMNKEEKILFPYILKLKSLADSREVINSPSFFALERPISIIELEHERFGRYLDQISKLSSGFTPSIRSRHTWKLYNSILMELETAVKEYIHIENNILYPEALAIEKSMTSGGVMLAN